MWDVRREIELLISEGRLLRDNKPARLTAQDWLEQYLRLQNEGKLKGYDQDKVLENLSLEIYARRFAGELRSSAKPSN